MEKWRNGEKGIEEKINRHIQYERKKRRSYQTLTNSIDIFNKQMQCNVCAWRNKKSTGKNLVRIIAFADYIDT